MSHESVPNISRRMAIKCSVVAAGGVLLAGPKPIFAQWRPQAGESFRFGPSGGLGGTPFDDGNMPSDERVIAVRIRAGSRIDAVQVQGSKRERPKHGGGGGTEFSMTLTDDEYITKLEGVYGAKVDSLRVFTNKRSSQKYGGGGGEMNFQYEAPPAYEIVGFLGRAGREIDALGVLVRKRP